MIHRQSLHRWLQGKNRGQPRLLHARGLRQGTQPQDQQPPEARHHSKSLKVRTEVDNKKWTLSSPQRSTKSPLSLKRSRGNAGSFPNLPKAQWQVRYEEGHEHQSSPYMMPLESPGKQTLKYTTRLRSSHPGTLPSPPWRGTTGPWRRPSTHAGRKGWVSWRVPYH